MRTTLSAIAAITLAAWTPNAPAQDRGASRALSFAQLQNVVSRVALYPDPLLAQVLAESVHLDDYFAEGVLSAAPPGSDRVITLPYGGQQIGNGLQRKPDFGDDG